MGLTSMKIDRSTLIITNMKKDIFSVDFWEFDLPDHPKIQKHLLDYIVSDEGTRQKLEESTQTNISQETYGGQEYLIGDFFFQTINDKVYEVETTPLKNFLVERILNLLKNVEKEHDWCEGHWGDLRYWLNINRKNVFNPPHLHPESHYSGVYYVKVPENCPAIHFLDPRPAHIYSLPDINITTGNAFSNNNKYDSSIYTYQPVEGKVVVFPSYLMHYVDPNPKENIRISLAFNVKYIN